MGTKFKDFIREISHEAQVEGTVAVEQLKAFQEFFKMKLLKLGAVQQLQAWLTTVQARSQQAASRSGTTAPRMIDRDSDIQPADEDKPHRCPNCWTIPEAARKTQARNRQAIPRHNAIVPSLIAGKAIAQVIYVCDKCNTRWRMENK